MGVSTRQNDLLKVVRPGRYVEVFQEPIMAAEIMKKYPRHCIARPDVFKFPWIVVRPESVLVPGEVFYLVPYHTIHNLLKSKQRQNRQNSSQKKLYSRNEYEHYGYSLRNSAIMSCARVTIKHLKHDMTNHESPESMDQDTDDESLSKVSCFAKMNSKPRAKTSSSHRNVNKEVYNRSHVDSSYESGPFSATRKGYRCITVRGHVNRMHETGHGHVNRPCIASSEHVNRLLLTGPGHVNQLKSCLRKQDSERRLLNLRVSFNLPVVIPSSRRESPELEEDDLAYQLQHARLN